MEKVALQLPKQARLIGKSNVVWIAGVAAYLTSIRLSATFGNLLVCCFRQNDIFKKEPHPLAQTSIPKRLVQSRQRIAGDSRLDEIVRIVTRMLSMINHMLIAAKDSLVASQESAFEVTLKEIVTNIFAAGGFVALVLVVFFVMYVLDCDRIEQQKQQGKSRGYRSFRDIQPTAEELQQRRLKRERLEQEKKREIEARRELHEKRQAEQERARARSEAIFLPRLEESFRLLIRSGTFSLVLECLRASEQCLLRQNLKRLYIEYRDAILKTAVKLMVSTKNESIVKQDLKELLDLMNQVHDLTPLLLDCHRDILLQTHLIEEAADFNSQLQSLIKEKGKKIEAIQHAPIEARDKEPLIEEIEAMFADEIAKLVRDCRS